MKTFEQIFSVALAICCVAVTGARNGVSAQPLAKRAAAVDTTVLASYRDGNYMVRRYMLSPRTENAADYTVMYQVDMSTMKNSIDENNAALVAFNSFIERIMADTMVRVSAVNIVGYSSPDGSYAANERLAEQRAEAFKNYVDQKYDLSAHYNVTTSAVAEDWKSCRQLVEASSDIPDKAKVLEVIDSSVSPDAKEQQLKAMPAAWNYMRQNILPQLRKVEVTVDYGKCRIVEQRILIEQPKPKPTPKPAPQRCCMCGDCCGCSGAGLVIEVDEALLDLIEDIVIEEIDAEIIEMSLP